MARNYSFSFSSFIFGFFLFVCLAGLAVGLGSWMQYEGIVADPGGWVIIFMGLGLYIAFRFARLIAKYECGVASPAWTAFFDKTKKAFFTTIVLGVAFGALGAIVGPQGGSELFLMLLVFSPVMSIYYAFIHPIIKGWMKAWVDRRRNRSLYPNQRPAGERSWVKEKLVPVIISSALPVILAYALTDNVTVSVSASLVGTLALLATGKEA